MSYICHRTESQQFSSTLSVRQNKTKIVHNFFKILFSLIESFWRATAAGDHQRSGRPVGLGQRGGRTRSSGEGEQRTPRYYDVEWPPRGEGGGCQQQQPRPRFATRAAKGGRRPRGETIEATAKDRGAVYPRTLIHSRVSAAARCFPVGHTTEETRRLCQSVGWIVRGEAGGLKKKNKTPEGGQARPFVAGDNKEANSLPVPHAPYHPQA